MNKVASMAVVLVSRFAVLRPVKNPLIPPPPPIPSAPPSLRWRSTTPTRPAAISKWITRIIVIIKPTDRFFYTLRATLSDCPKVIGLQGRAADETAIDIRLRQ